MKHLKYKTENRKVKFHNKEYEIEFSFYVDEEGNEYITNETIEENNHILYDLIIKDGFFLNNETVISIKEKNGLTLGKEYKIKDVKTYYGSYVIVNNDNNEDVEYPAWYFDILEDDEEEFELNYE